ncbi:MAG: penicillin-binding protein activator, partial [Bdellovibrionales bacterium]|nr:penicillin-binding protein activator [Bdellovibrionales bacterium]
SIEARERLRVFLDSHGNSPFAPEAAQLLRKMRENSTSGGATLGLLLPLKGRFSSVSQKVIQSATLALGIFGPNADQKVELIIEDSGDDAESALAALERLYSKHRVAAVLGPILSKGSGAIIQRAEELGLPLVSLAQQQTENLGEFSSQAAIGPALQTRELARQAIQVMGLKRFAILAPKDKFGSEYSQHFWNAVDQLGGTVTAYETYESGETDFRKSVDRLAGLFYSDSRQRELKTLAEERDQNQIKKKTRKTEKFFNLPPVVNFDAVFIADEPKTASFALPTFTYRDIDQIQFLGLSTWNSSDFIQRAQKAANGVIFMDAYFPLAAAPSVRDFSAKFKGTFGIEASSFEAVVFDSALNLGRLISAESRGSAVDRSKLAVAIRQIRDVPSVTGKISVSNGVWIRELRPLTIRDSEVVEWTPTSSASHGKAATSAD